MKRLDFEDGWNGVRRANNTISEEIGERTNPLAKWEETSQMAAVSEIINNYFSFVNMKHLQQLEDAKQKYTQTEIHIFKGTDSMEMILKIFLDLN